MTERDAGTDNSPINAQVETGEGYITKQTDQSDWEDKDLDNVNIVD